MSNLTVAVQHQLTQADALARVQNLIAQLKAQYGDMINITKEQWTGNVGAFAGSAKGTSVSGTITANPNDVTVQMNVPFPASVFKGKIADAIRAQLTQILEGPLSV
jgi:putative polyhydroxyalkanoic acid system protein